MGNGRDYLSLKNRRVIPSFLAGIAAETMYTLVLVALGAAAVLVLRLLVR